MTMTRGEKITMIVIAIALLTLGGVATYYGNKYFDNREINRQERCVNEVITGIAVAASRQPFTEYTITDSPIYNGTIVCVLQENIIRQQ